MSNKAFKKELQLSKAFDLLVKIKDSRITEMFWKDLKRTVIHVLRQKKKKRSEALSYSGPRGTLLMPEGSAYMQTSDG